MLETLQGLKDYDFHGDVDKENNVITKVHLVLFLRLLQEVCETKDDLEIFIVLFCGIRSGNIIQNDWLNMWRGKCSPPGKVDALLQKMVTVHLLKFKHGVGAILNPALIMHGLTKTERGDLRREYASLNDKPFSLDDDEHEE